MIPQSVSWKLLAAGAAVAAHGALGFALYAPEDVQVAAQQGSANVRIGTGFADMAAGTLTAKAATPEVMAPVQPTQSHRAQPNAIIAAQSPTSQYDAPQTGTLGPQAVIASTSPVNAISTLRAADAKSASSTTRPSALTQPKAVTARAPSQEIETIAATDNLQAAPLVSMRPQQRTKAFETANAPKAQPTPRPEPQVTSRGTSTRNATAGANSGNRNATASRQGTTQGTATAQGNAAASNYPGQVWSKLSRVRRPNGRGTAQVRFTIAPNGGIASLSIANSSGNSRFDRDALQIVRRAGPFPRPPQGARRTFTFTVQGG